MIIETFFDALDSRLAQVPEVIEETAIEYYRNSFVKESWDGNPWQPLSPAYAKRKKRGAGRILTATSTLSGSITGMIISQGRVVISAGGAKTPYARIHNEGGTIQHAARSETFLRNRSRRGRFATGTTAGQGQSFQPYTVNMPKRQFMGFTKELREQILTRIKAL